MNLLIILTTLCTSGIGQAAETIIFQDEEVPNFYAVNENGIISVIIVEPLVSEEYDLLARSAKLVTDRYVQLPKFENSPIDSL